MDGKDIPQHPRTFVSRNNQGGCNFGTYPGKVRNTMLRESTARWKRFRLGVQENQVSAEDP